VSGNKQAQNLVCWIEKLMRLLWNMWVEAKTKDKALKLCQSLLERMGKDATGKEAEPYPKTGGFVVSFATEIEDGQWNDVVVEAIALGQRVGSGWILSGDIYDDPSGWSNETKISGIRSLQWALKRGKKRMPIPRHSTLAESP
jgi:hypothetical protein